MATFEYPAVTGFNLKAEVGFLVPGSLYPSWLPVDGVDMHDRQARALPKLTRQRAFA